MKVLTAALLLLLTACQAQLPHATLDKDHQLNGKIWSVTNNRFVSYQDLIAAATNAKYVLLGEKHDNPDHHQFQAQILNDMIKAGRRPAVAFEMLNWDQTPALNAFIDSQPMDASGLGQAVKWSRTGWPAWSWYAPIANAALAADVPILAANFPRSLSRKLAREGFKALPPELLSRSKLDVPLSPEQSKLLEDDIFHSHCKMMPRKHLGSVIRVQQTRDAILADALIEGAKNQGSAVLIAGAGHVRNDRAVPRYVSLRQPDSKNLALAFIEVQPNSGTPADYAEPYGEKLPFDFVWFTARLEDVDPCEKFKEQLKKMKSKKGAS